VGRLAPIRAVMSCSCASLGGTPTQPVVHALRAVARVRVSGRRAQELGASAADAGEVEGSHDLPDRGPPTSPWNPVTDPVRTPSVSPSRDSRGTPINPRPRTPPIRSCPCPHAGLPHVLSCAIALAIALAPATRAQPARRRRRVRRQRAPTRRARCAWLRAAMPRVAASASELVPDPGWHLYGRDPGEIGLPPEISWQLPGARFGELRMAARDPIPRRHDPDRELRLRRHPCVLDDQRRVPRDAHTLPAGDRGRDRVLPILASRGHLRARRTARRLRRRRTDRVAARPRARSRSRPGQTQTARRCRRRPTSRGGPRSCSAGSAGSC
jgi:hypothetical protein